MKRILATLSFFTRLPFWRLATLEKKHYERVVPLWPLVGWITGGMMGLVTFLTFGLPTYMSVVMALITRVLVTGALHEDGFADFCDGFGGGNGKARILEIMKDSHIGTYGVLGLILYFMLLTSTLVEIKNLVNDAWEICATMIIADVFCKWCASTIIYFLPYARKEEEAKNKLVYANVPVWEKIVSLALGLLPMFVLLPFTQLVYWETLISACCASIITVAFMALFMKRRIQGYTGDCCGATFIITELVFYIVTFIS